MIGESVDSRKKVRLIVGFKWESGEFKEEKCGEDFFRVKKRGFISEYTDFSSKVNFYTIFFWQQWVYGGKYGQCSKELAFHQQGLGLKSPANM